LKYFLDTSALLVHALNEAVRAVAPDTSTRRDARLPEVPGKAHAV
jgi:hypothetical protein